MSKDELVSRMAALQREMKTCIDLKMISTKQHEIGNIARYPPLSLTLFCILVLTFYFLHHTLFLYSAVDAFLLQSKPVTV